MRCKNVPMMRGMSWWNEKSQVVAESAAIAAPVVDREAAALAVVRELKGELAALDGEMLAFKKKHKIRTNRFGVLLSVESPAMTGYPAIRGEWDALLRRRDNTVARWHKALHEWSEAKGAAK